MADTTTKDTTAPTADRKYQHASTERGDRKTIIGLVVSDKMVKTITVQVTRLEKHKKYKKYLRRHSKFYAHDEKRDAKVGDTVEILETRPTSKMKRWRLVKILARAGTSGVAPKTS
jgi:small subunit ribosomal protein S17